MCVPRGALKMLQNAYHRTLLTYNVDGQDLSKALTDMLNDEWKCDWFWHGQTMSSVYCGIEKIGHAVPSLIPVDPPLGSEVRASIRGWQGTDREGWWRTLTGSGGDRREGGPSMEDDGEGKGENSMKEGIGNRKRETALLSAELILHIGRKCCLTVENTFTPTTEVPWWRIYLQIQCRVVFHRIKKVINSGVGKAILTPFLHPKNIHKKAVWRSPARQSTQPSPETSVQSPTFMEIEKFLGVEETER